VYLCVHICSFEQFFFCENIFALQNFSVQNVLNEHFLYVFMYK